MLTCPYQSQYKFYCDPGFSFWAASMRCLPELSYWVLCRDPRTAWSAHRSVRVGAIFFGFYWSWCGAVRVFQKLFGTGAVRSEILTERLMMLISGVALLTNYQSPRVERFNFHLIEFCPSVQPDLILNPYLRHPELNVRGIWLNL